MRPVQKVSSRFEYLENQSHGLDVTWQPIRGDLTVSHSSVGLVSRQWDAVDWACVLCDHHIQKSPPSQWRLYLWKKPEVAGSQIWAVGRLTDLGDVMLCQKFPHENCRMGRRIVVMKLICSLGHCESDGQTVHKLSQRRLTANWPAPWESDVHGCTLKSPLTGCQVTSRLREQFSRCSKWMDTFWAALVY